MAVLDNVQAPQEPAPFWNTALRFGAYCGLAFVVFSLISYLMGISPVSISSMIINFVVALAVSVGFAAMAIKHQRDNLDHGFMSYGRGLLIGLVTVAIGVFISNIWNYVLMNYIDPDYVNTIKESFLETWGDNMPAEALEQSMERFDQMADLGTNLKNGVIGAVVIGLIAGLISAAIMKKDKPVN